MVLNIKSAIKKSNVKKDKQELVSYETNEVKEDDADVKTAIDDENASQEINE